MNEAGATVGTQVNTELARCFRQIVTAGWANMSDGHVESPVGYFSLVTIEPNELASLADAVFDGEETPTIYPGAYLVVEDSGGNTTLNEYLSNNGALRAFKALQRMYNDWLGAADGR